MRVKADTLRGLSARLRAGPLTLAIGATALAAAIAAVLPLSGVVPLLYALPVLVAALLLLWPEAALVALLGLGLFLAADGVNHDTSFVVVTPSLAALCVAALLIARRHRERGVSAAARVMPEAGALGVIASGLAATLDVGQLLGMVADELCASLGVGRCAIHIVEGESLRLAASTAHRAELSRADRPFLLADVALTLTEPLTIARGDDRTDDAAMAASDARRALVLPLRAYGDLIGIATLDEPGRSARFDSLQRAIGTAIAGFAALTVHNARLFERQAQLTQELRARSATTETLLRLGNELRATYDLDSVLEKVGATVLDALGYREVAIYVYEEQNEVFLTRVALGGSTEINDYYLTHPIPYEMVMNTMRPEFRIGDSYFRSQRRHPATAEEDEAFPCSDLGPRAAHEWQTGDGLFVPLLSGDQRLLGVLDVYDPADRGLPTLESVRILELFANQAAIAIENALGYRELQEQGRRLERQLASQRDLLRVSESVLATLDEQTTFESIADKLGLLVEYDTLALSKVDYPKRKIVTVFARDEWAEELMANPLELGEGLTGWVVAHDEAVLSNDTVNDPRSVIVPGTPDDPQSSILVPLKVMNKVIGVLGLDRLGGKTFSAEELELVKPFANLAAIAIENASLYEKSRQRAITDALTGLYNHGHFQETLAREVKRCERYGEGFSLMMLDLDHFKQVNDRFGHPQGDRVLKRVAKILMDSSRESDYVARYGGEEFVLVLLRTSADDACALAERIRGRIRKVKVGQGADFHVSASIGVADFPGCGLDASTVLAAADSALLWAKRRGRNCVLFYRDVREMMISPPAAQDREDFWRSGMEVLAEAVDAKASFRERHSLAVSQMVRQLAAAAGVSATEQETLAVAARLHDVGKVGIAAEILEKSGRLSPEERRELHKHAGVGVDILANADAPRELYPIVLHHHERWDGTGYPEGLAGEEIPAGARMLAICDAFQAMLSDRPHRAALTLDAARHELRRQAGAQFDPSLVTVFLDTCAVSGAEVGASGSSASGDGASGGGSGASGGGGGG